MITLDSKVGREDVIPVVHQGGWHEATAYVIGGLEVNRPFHTDNDPRRMNALTSLLDLRSVYGRDGIYDSAYSYGMIEGVELITSLLQSHGFDNAVNIARQLDNDRLSAIANIEAIFYTHGWGDPNSELVDQNGGELLRGEVFAFALRRAFNYAIGLAMRSAYARSKRTSSDAAMSPLFKSFGCFSESQKRFVRYELPALRTAYGDRPSTYEIDLLGQGWSLGRDAINAVCDGARLPLEDLAGTFTRNFVFRQRLLKALRDDSVLFHIFRLGFGNFDCRPSADNKVFDRLIPINAIGVDDTVEVIECLSKAGKKNCIGPKKSWLEQ